MTRRGLTLGWEEPPPFWEVQRKGTLDLKLRVPVTDPEAPPDPAQRQGDEMDSDSLSGLEQGSSREAGSGRGRGSLDVATPHARVSPSDACPELPACRWGMRRGSPCGRDTGAEVRSHSLGGKVYTARGVTRSLGSKNRPLSVGRRSLNEPPQMRRELGCCIQQRTEAPSSLMRASIT